MDDQKRKISKIEIDKNTCIGCGTCVVLSPKTFEINGEGFSEAKDSWKEVDDEEIMNAARSCPTNAIILFDQEGNRINL